MNAETARTLGLVKVEPVGDGRALVFEPVFCHPHFGWQIRTVIEGEPLTD